MQRRGVFVPQFSQLIIAILAMFAQEVTSQTCTVSPAGHCTLNQGKDVTCGTQPFFSTRRTVDHCNAIDCTSKNSCNRFGIINSNRVQCGSMNGSGISCYETVISNVTETSCQGDGACVAALIKNVPAGGEVNCIGGNGAHGYSCNRATITSTNPFTLTCKGNIGTKGTCHRGGGITNPGGSVFCYGGTTNGGSCHDLSITNDVGCLICGNSNACEDVRLENAPNLAKNIFSVPNHQVWMKDSCTADNVVSYLNKIHPSGGTACQDSNNNGICDVVETYCEVPSRRGAGQTESSCHQQFSLTLLWATTGTGTTTTTVSATDPDSMQGQDQEKPVIDETGLESWILGGIVIVVFAFLMGTTVLYLGHKNHWSWWKQWCGPKNKTVNEVKTVEQAISPSLLQKMQSVNRDEPTRALMEFDEILKEQEILMGLVSEEDTTEDGGTSLENEEMQVCVENV